MHKIAFTLIVAMLTQAAISHPVAAQSLTPSLTPSLSPSRSSILVLNQDRLLAQTEFGIRIQEEVESASVILAAQNRRFEEQLTAEELELTRQRPLMSSAEFRELADEFDARVVSIRNTQAATARDLQAQAEAAQQVFFETTLPVLLQIVEQRGASVLLDSRSVLLSAGTVDITDAAIAAVDARLGRGDDAPLVTLPGLSDPLLSETENDPAPQDGEGDLEPDTSPVIDLDITPDP